MLIVWVAPLAGAWIEIALDGVNQLPVMSLPLRERGLKYLEPKESWQHRGVAPLAGAWIEIKSGA